MRMNSIIAIAFLLSGTLIPARRVLPIFDKLNFYQVMATEKLSDINDELVIISASSFPEKEAYEGALLMKKAGLLKKPSAKLQTFRSGCIKLETALEKDSMNTEYHFLRLSIQEHAPRIVRYFKDLEHDRLFIDNTFNSLSPAIQKVIIDYSKHSKILHMGDFRTSTF